MPKTLAIFSPHKNSYSETFIQAHRNLPFNIKYYYGDWVPNNLDGKSSLLNFTIFERIIKKVSNQFTLAEFSLLYSLKREKVNCILAEYGLSASATLEVAKYLKIPMVVHFHGFDASVKSVLEEYNEQYKKVFAYAHSIIVVSKKMKEDLISLGCPSAKLTIATCGGNDDFFKINTTYLKPNFISIGRFVFKKGPYLTIVAFKKVIAEFPSAKLIMIGDGELLQLCKNLVNALDLNHNIEFKGILNPKEIQSYMKDSMAFVQHSVVAEDGDSEGTPVAVIEAQAAALPVISTFHAGIPDVVIHNETGLLSKEYDVDTMAKNMIRILKEDGLAKRLGLAGRTRTSLHFTMEKHLSILEKNILAACQV